MPEREVNETLSIATDFSREKNYNNQKRKKNRKNARSMQAMHVRTWQRQK